METPLRESTQCNLVLIRKGAKVYRSFGIVVLFEDLDSKR